MTSTWAGSYEFRAPETARPTSVDELQGLVAGARRVHAVGSRHSFHDIADSAGVLVATDGLPFSVEVDTERAIARVPAGARYGDIAPLIDARGFALANLASLPHISVAGTVATGTHGSGDGNRTLSTAVSALELVTATGEAVRIDRDDPRLSGAVVSLGALGVVTHLELDLVPRFDVAQTVYDRIPLDSYLEHFDEITALGYSVSAFTHLEPGVIDSVWVKVSDGGTPAPADLLGSKARVTDRHMIDGGEVAATSPQAGVPGPWYERLPHFRLAFTPSAGEEVQSEYLLPRGQARAAIQVAYALGSYIRPLLLAAEIRTVAADELWLSGARGRDTVGLHFTWRRRVPEVLAVLSLLERELIPLGARPHWGKLFATDDPFSLHPDSAAFAALVASLDPAGVFRGPFLERYLR